MNKRLKLKIIELYDSQEDFAEAMEIDRATVSRTINGRRILSHKEKNRWAKKLKCEPGDIFGD